MILFVFFFKLISRYTQKVRRQNATKMLEGLRKMEGILPDGCYLSNFQEGKNVCYDNVYALANIYLK